MDERKPPVKVESAVKTVSAHCKQMRQELGIKGHLLDSAVLQKIMDAYSQPQDSPMVGHHYEIGHRFISEHVLAALKQKINLNPGERKLVKQFLGRVYYNPPKREYVLREAASNGLDALGARGNEIFAALSAEYGEIVEYHHQVKMRSDMFGNPLFSMRSRFGTYSNFKQLAGWFGECKGSTHVYE